MTLLPKEEKLRQMAAEAAALSGTLGEPIIILGPNAYSASEKCSRADALSMANNLILGMLESFAGDKNMDREAVAELLKGLTSFVSDVSELVEAISATLELPAPKRQVHPSVQ